MYFYAETTNPHSLFIVLRLLAKKELRGARAQRLLQSSRPSRIQHAAVRAASNAEPNRAVRVWYISFLLVLRHLPAISNLITLQAVAQMWSLLPLHTWEMLTSRESHSRA